MPDSFDVELQRLTRALDAPGGSSRPDNFEAFELLSHLVELESSARGIPATSPPADPHVLPIALHAVAFDAEAAGVDLEALSEEAVRARRALTARDA